MEQLKTGIASIVNQPTYTRFPDWIHKEPEVQKPELPEPVIMSAPVPEKEEVIIEPKPQIKKKPIRRIIKKKPYNARQHKRKQYSARQNKNTRHRQ